MADDFQEIFDAEEIDDDKLNGKLEDAIEVLRIAREMRPPAEPPRVLSPTSFHQTWEEGCVKSLNALADIRSGQVLSAERLQEIINILNIAQHHSPYVADAVADEGEDDENEEPEPQNEIQPASPIHQPETQDDDDPVAVAMGHLTISPTRQEPPREPEAPPSEERKIENDARWIEEGEDGYVPPDERVSYQQLPLKSVLLRQEKVFHDPRVEKKEQLGYYRKKGIDPVIFDPNNPQHTMRDPLQPENEMKYSLERKPQGGNDLYSHMLYHHRYLFFLSKDDCPLLDEDKGKKMFCGCSAGNRDGYSTYGAYETHIKRGFLHNQSEEADKKREKHRLFCLRKYRGAQSSS